MTSDLWKKLTSTVGLVCTRHDGVTNVMSAEWAFFVNKQPLYAAVVLGPRSATRKLIEGSGEFSVTLCAEDQAEIADFAGSHSLTDIDKTAGEPIRLGEPDATATPWVKGGVAAVECLLRRTVDLPVHTMYIGEVVAEHVPDRPRRPLVKHGAMYGLGDPLVRTAVVATAELRPGGVLRVAATAPAHDSTRTWRVTLLDTDGAPTPLGSHPSSAHGDLLVDIEPPCAVEQGYRVRVETQGAKPGFSAISGAAR